MVIEVPACSGDLLVEVILKPSRYEAFIQRTKYMKVVYIFNLVCVTTRYSPSQKLFYFGEFKRVSSPDSLIKFHSYSVHGCGSLFPSLTQNISLWKHPPVPQIKDAGYTKGLIENKI